MKNVKNKNEKLLVYYKDNKILNKIQKKTMNDYDEHYILKGAKESTRASAMKVLFYLCRDIKKPFKSITKQDIISFFANYTIRKWGGKSRNNFVDTGKKPSRETLRTYEQTAQYFFEWLKKKDIAEYLKSIRPTKKLDGRAKPSDVWTEKEIKTLIASARTLRNKTAISVLYEMAGRVSEAIGLNIGDVKFNDDGTTELSITESKTEEGRATTRFLFSSTPLLKEYIESHPLKHDINAPLFVSHHDQKYRGNKAIERLQYGGWLTILKYSHKRCGIKKKLYLHLLRVSRASNMIKTGYSLPIVQQTGAWRNVNSMRPYLKLSSDDVRNALLEKNGGKKKTKEEERIKNQKCLKCGETNSFDKKYCYKCSTILDPTELFRQKEKQEQVYKLLNRVSKVVLENKEFIEKLKQDKEAVTIAQQVKPYF